MKRSLFSFLLIILFLTGYAQQPDSSFRVRLDSFFHLNHLKDLDRVLDYTYPKLFTVVSREQMLGVMKSTFETEEMTISLDSLQVVKTWPMLSTQEGSFVQMEYSMIMRMQFRQMDSTDTPEKMETISSLLTMKYGAGNARYDSLLKQIVIFNKSPLLAIKDDLSPQWTFINYIKDDPLIQLLLSEDIIDKLSKQQ